MEPSRPAVHLWPRIIHRRRVFSFESGPTVVPQALTGDSVGAGPVRRPRNHKRHQVTGSSSTPATKLSSLNLSSSTGTANRSVGSSSATALMAV